MPTVGPPLLGYDIVVVDGENPIYLFTTDTGISYQVRFKSSGYLLDNPDWDHLFLRWPLT